MTKDMESARAAGKKRVTRGQSGNEGRNEGLRGWVRARGRGQGEERFRPTQGRK